MKQSWSYDWLGNTTASTDDANLFYDRSLGAIGNDGYRLRSATRSTYGLTASYDAAGYMKTMSITRAGVVPQQYDYEWDEVGRLTKATRKDSGVQAAELTYAYDASDQRVRKSAGSRHAIYVFGSLELRSTDFDNGVYTVDNASEVPYLFGHGVRLARVTYIGATEFKDARRRIFLELGDHLGSTSVVMDRATGQLVERSTAYAYGAAESHYRPGDWYEFREDYRFTGKEDDIEVGLIYFGARYLNPQLGRWISADPLAVHAPGKADLNLYAYVHGKVLSAVDPVGLDGSDAVRNFQQQFKNNDLKAAMNTLNGMSMSDMLTALDHLTPEQRAVAQGAMKSVQGVNSERMQFALGTVADQKVGPAPNGVGKDQVAEATAFLQGRAALNEARRHQGTRQNNPADRKKISGWLNAAMGNTVEYSSMKEFPSWCGAFVNHSLKLGGQQTPVSGAALAATYKNSKLWGTSAGAEPVYGSVVVLKTTKTQYHVAFVVGVLRNPDGGATHVVTLGGNQANKAGVPSVIFKAYSLDKVQGFFVPDGYGVPAGDLEPPDLSGAGVLRYGKGHE